MRGVLFSNLDDIVINKDLISDCESLDKWHIIPYKCGKISGRITLKNAFQATRPLMVLQVRIHTMLTAVQQGQACSVTAIPNPSAIIKIFCQNSIGITMIFCIIEYMMII